MVLYIATDPSSKTYTYKFISVQSKYKNYHARSYTFVLF